MFQSLIRTWTSSNIVKSEISNTIESQLVFRQWRRQGVPWVELEEEGEWLSDTTSGTEDGDLGELIEVVSL